MNDEATGEELELTRCNVACPLCQSRSHRRLMVGTDLLHRCPGQFNIVRCESCGHVFVNPRPRREDLEQFYPDDYGPHSTTKPQEPAVAGATTSARSQTPPESNQSKPFYLRIGLQRLPGARSFYHWLVDDHAEFIPPLPGAGAAALDLGCGAGGMLERLRTAGWEARGVEPSPRAAQIAGNRGFDVHCGTIEDAAFGDESFDAVFAWMVLEHLPDPLKTLGKIHRVLRPHGWFIFSVPNFASWERVLFGRYWHALETPRHLQHFQPRSIRRLLADSEFELVEMIHHQSLNQFAGSVGLWLQQRRWLPKVARRLIEIPHRPSVVSTAMLAPGAKLAAWVKQSGRLTVIARKRGQNDTESARDR
jgi:SAM-dependent methyltransferase